MEHQDSPVTHRPAENKSVPSRADEVSNVRGFIYAKIRIFLSIIFYTALSVMTDQGHSYLMLYKIF